MWMLAVNIIIICVVLGRSLILNNIVQSIVLLSADHYRTIVVFRYCAWQTAQGLVHNHLLLLTTMLQQACLVYLLLCAKIATLNLNCIGSGISNVIMIVVQCTFLSLTHTYLLLLQIKLFCLTKKLC